MGHMRPHEESFTYIVGSASHDVANRGSPASLVQSVSWRPEAPTEIPIMRTCSASVLAALAAVLALPLPADAQLGDFDEPRGPAHLDVSAVAGWLAATDWSDLVVLGNVSSGGIVQQVLVRELNVGSGAGLDVAVTYWEGRYGFRVHGGFSDSCLAVGRTCGQIGAEGGTAGLDMYRYDVGGAIGLLSYTPRRWAWPYVFLGLGGVTYDLDETVGPPLGLVVSRPDDAGGQGGGVRASDTVLVTVEELGVETRLAFTIGVGTDFRLPLGNGGMGVRLEVADTIHRSPIDLSVTHIGGLFGADPEEVVFDPVHNLRASAGVVVQFGR